MIQRFEQHSVTLLKPVPISPRSFKRQLETVLGALAQLRIRVTIYAKLPRGSSWSADLRQYAQATHPTPPIYLLNRESTTASTEFTSVRIPTAYPMQGEYFLLAVSPTVGLMITGERENISLPVDTVSSERDTAPAEEPESLTRVKYNLTLQIPLIRQKLEELRQIFQASCAEYSDQSTIAPLLNDWETHTSLPEYCQPALVDAILLQESVYQEQLQQKARAYRRQATNASTLSTQNEALLDSLRLKDSFLNTVGQELRAPLSSIKTALPLLSSPSLKPPQRQRYLEMISRECDRQVNLINGVLELLQIERSLVNANPAPVKLFDILPGIVSTYQPLAQEKGIRLAYTVPNTLPAICCPEAWVRQIVIHLLNNSIRYTDSGGEVWVTAQSEDEEMLTVNVRDTGIGIPQQELPHIFDHFYRGKQIHPEEEGAGLGLSIVQQLIVYCGGQISVESQPEVGTHFTVKLPQYRSS